MRKGMKHMMLTCLTIDKIIESPTKKPSKEESARILRACGIYNEKNNIKKAYKKILSVEPYHGKK